MSEIVTRNPAQELVAQIRSDRIRPILEAQLPEDVTFEKFVGALGRALMENPDIAMWDKSLIAVLRIAEMGLVPDGKEAAVAPFKNKKTGRLEAQAMPMRLGVVKTSARHGWSLRAKAVHAADEFDWTDEPPEITHRQARPGVERGPIIAAYAIARHKDGRREQLVMLAEDIAKRRKMAKQQGTWEQWPEEQSEKTVAHALFRKLPLDPADKHVATMLRADLVDDPLAALYPSARTLELEAPLEAGSVSTPADEQGPTPDEKPSPAGAAPATDSETGAEDAAPAPSPFTPPGLATDAQKAKLNVLYGQLTGDDEDVKRQFCVAAGGREGERWPDVRERLTKKRASELIDHLERLAQGQTA